MDHACGPQGHHEPPTEAQLRAARSRPYPEAFTRLSADLERRAVQREAEGEREYIRDERNVKAEEPSSSPPKRGVRRGHRS